jgi:hypothetical protein
MQKLGAPLLELEERSSGTRRLTVSDMGESFLASRVSFGITRIDAAEGSETLIRHDPRPFQNLAVLTYEQRALLAATEREIEEHVRDLMERMAVRLQPGFQKISLVRDRAMLFFSCDLFALYRFAYLVFLGVAWIPGLFSTSLRRRARPVRVSFAPFCTATSKTGFILASPTTTFSISTCISCSR